jgi:hypothetical protein
MTTAERRQQSQIRQQQTNESGVLQSGRITLNGLETIRKQIASDLKEAQMGIFSADQFVNRQQPLSPKTYLHIYGEFYIRDFEAAKAKCAEYGHDLILDVTGYDMDNNPLVASFSINILTMQQ